MPTLLNVPSITNTGGGTSTGDTLVLTLTFDVSVNGLTSGTDNTIFLLGGSPTEASWGGTGSTRTLTFSITSGDNGDVTIDEAALKSALVSGITDGTGTAFTYTANSGNIADITAGLTTVDTTSPIPASTNTWSVSDLPTGQRVFLTDDVIDVTLTMSEALIINNTASNSKIVAGGKDFGLDVTKSTDAGNNKLVFSYTVETGVYIDAANFKIASRDDIILTGITDTVGNTPDLSSITTAIALAGIGTSSNLALTTRGIATLTTTIDSWNIHSAASSIASIADGNKSTAGSLDYAVHPLNAQGKNITFTLDRDYIDGSFILYNRSILTGRVDGSSVKFYNDDAVVHQATISSAGVIVTVAAPIGVVFDKVDLTFPTTGDGNQNFREIEIMGRPTLAIDALGPNLDDVLGVHITPEVFSVGAAFYSNAPLLEDTDIATIKAVISGKKTGDKWLLDTTGYLLNTNINQVNKTVGGVSGVDYTFDSVGNVLLITKNGGGVFTAVQVKSIIESVRLQNTETPAVLGLRSASIRYIDEHGNEGSSTIANMLVQNLTNEGLSNLLTTQITALTTLVNEVKVLATNNSGGSGSSTPASFIKPGS